MTNEVIGPRAEHLIPHRVECALFLDVVLLHEHEERLAEPQVLTGCGAVQTPVGDLLQDEPKDGGVEGASANARREL